MMDEKRFNWFFKEYYKALVFYSNRFLNDRDRAEDVVQEVFCTAATYDFKGNDKMIISWLYTCVRNASIDVIRYEYSKSRKWTEIDVLNDFAEHQPVIDEVVYAETINLLYKYVEMLPDRCRAIMRLYLYQGLSEPETAKKLNIAFQTVKNHRQRGFDIIRQRFQYNGLTKAEHDDIQRNRAIAEKIIGYKKKNPKAGRKKAAEDLKMPEASIDFYLKKILGSSFYRASIT